MILIVVALLEEAKPIIQNYKLKILQNKKFNIFTNDNIALIVSGIGKINAAIATTYIASIYKDSIKTFLNIGIAGHLNLPIGQLVSIYKIAKDKKNYFLSDLIEVGTLSKPLITVDKPQKDYVLDFVYDMEAEGYFEAASKFSFVDLIYSLKIISDNKLCNFYKVTKNVIISLIEQNLEKIKKIIINLVDLKSKIISKKIEIPFFIKTLYLTNYEQNHINELIWKIKALREDFSFDNFFDKCKNKEQVFEVLEDLYMKLSMIL